MKYIVALRLDNRNFLFEFPSTRQRSKFIEQLPEHTEYATSVTKG